MSAIPAVALATVGIEATGQGLVLQPAAVLLSHHLTRRASPAGAPSVAKSSQSTSAPRVPPPHLTNGVWAYIGTVPDWMGYLRCPIILAGFYAYAFHGYVAMPAIAQFVNQLVLDVFDGIVARKTNR